MQSRSLQDGARSNIHVPRCPTSYFDTTGGKAYWWACGASCQGAFYTDGNCECACKRSTAAPTMTTRTPRRVTARPTMEAPRTPTTRLRQAVLPVDSLEPVRSRVGNAPVGQAFSHHPSNFTAVESKPALVVSLEETRADSQNGVVLAVICVVVLFLVAISVIFYGMLCMMDRNNSLQTPPKVHVSPPSHVPVMLKFQTAPVPALQIWKPSEGQLVQIRGQGLLHVNALQAHAGDPASKSAQSSSRTSDTRTPSAWSTTASECFHGNAPSVGSEVQIEKFSRFVMQVCCTKRMPAQSQQSTPGCCRTSRSTWSMLDAATEALAALGTATGTGLLSAAAASVAVVAAVAPADCCPQPACCCYNSATTEAIPTLMCTMSS